METPETNAGPAPSEEDLVEVRKPTSLLVAQFFLFPLIIIGICIGIFLFFGYLSYELNTPEQYLGEIRSGSETQRWHAAFELSNLVQADPDGVRSPEFVASLTNAYKDSSDADIRVRGFVALMLGNLRERAVVPVLVEGLRREEQLKGRKWEDGLMRPSIAEIQENLIQTQIWTLWALGSIGDNSAVPGVLEQAGSPDPSVRKMVAYVLGALKDKRAIPDLRILLNDSKEDVQWNAALALAQLSNAEGAELLMKMAEPNYLDGMEGMSQDQKTEVRVNAVRALGMLKHAPAREQITAMGRNDPVLAVRNASLEALKKF
jgi:HEAT repeat protein